MIIDLDKHYLQFSGIVVSSRSMNSHPRDGSDSTRGSSLKPYGQFQNMPVLEKSMVHTGYCSLNHKGGCDHILELVEIRPVMYLGGQSVTSVRS